MIPPILHHVWFGSRLPKYAVEFARTWKEHEPKLELVLWASHPKELEEELGGDHPWGSIEPMPRFLQHDIVPTMDAYVRQDVPAIAAAMSDLMRLQLVEEYGGIYVDLDVLCFRPLGWIKGRSCIVSEEHWAHHIGNFFIAAEPNHVAMTEAHRRIRERVVKVRRKGRPELVSPVTTTGPHSIGPIWNDMAKVGALTVLPYQRLSPWNPHFAFPFDSWREIEWPEQAFGCHAFSTDWSRREMISHEGRDPFAGKFHQHAFPDEVARTWRRTVVDDSKGYR